VICSWCCLLTYCNTQRPPSAYARDEDVPARPSTAFITSFLEQQGVLPTQTTLLPLTTKRPSTSDGLRIATGEGSHCDILTLDHESFQKSPVRSLAPIPERPSPGVGYTQQFHRPSTSDFGSTHHPSCNTDSFDTERHLQSCGSAPSLPIRPLTSYAETTRPMTGQSRPGTSRRLHSRAGPFSGDPPPVVFPASNTDTIPSINSSIVKYKSSREHMLDTLNLPSKEQRAKAHKRAVERAKVACIAGDDASMHSSRSKGGNQGDTIHSRFDVASQNSLVKVGITANAGTISSAPTSNFYCKARLKEVRSLRDQMRTTSGSFQLHANDQFALQGMHDPHVAARETREAAQRVKATCEEDHTKELVKLQGFFETVGAENIYMSETHKFFKDDPKLKEAIRKRGEAHVTKADHVREWANSALLDGRKLFHNNGGGFCI
jgi:hypothetical protein